MDPQPPTTSTTKLTNDLLGLLQTTAARVSNTVAGPTHLPRDLMPTATALSTYLTHIATRRSSSPVSADNLSFHILRTRNKAETILDFDARPPKVLSKGKKEWYYLVLSETSDTGDVQILLEGGLRKNKSDVLVGFIEVLDTTIKTWEQRTKQAERIQEAKDKWNAKGKMKSLLQVQNTEAAEKQKRRAAEKKAREKEKEERREPAEKALREMVERQRREREDKQMRAREEGMGEEEEMAKEGLEDDEWLEKEGEMDAGDGEGVNRWEEVDLDSDEFDF
ncbi:hypothetical protein FB567DRAFT_529966 [Paraphoma chrysanthemicola]|uniref:Uncharacterized protein n=1 Tax=Paraphoma chrysanthemicola TaxID=798071 RepID=A0A8K0VXH0_9PLEO|nr:hypothetical protein FB567DRAFT_529966 [Paraphoma chrysanthemicola]